MAKYKWTTSPPLMVDLDMEKVDVTFEPKDIVSDDIESLTISWSNLDYFVTTQYGNNVVTKQCVSGLNGCVKPGEIMAVLGNTGSGKSTVLNLLCGNRLGEGRVEGSVKLNGFPRPIGSRKYLAYVGKADVLMPVLTVAETLHMYAQLRMGRGFTKHDRHLRIQSILKEMGLTHAAQRLVGGNAENCISLAERRRLMIGCELVTNPSILFIEEPTAHLDTFMGFNVIKHIRQAATRGRAIIVTLTHPRNTTLNICDKILLLSRGAAIFYGPSSDAAVWLKQCGLPCPPDVSVADHLLDVTMIDARSARTEQETRARNIRLVEEYKNSTYATTAIKEANGPPLFPQSTTRNHPSQSSFIRQTLVLARRFMRHLARDWLPTLIEAGQLIGLAVLFGLLFFHMQERNSPLADVAGLLMAVVMVWLVIPPLAAARSFLDDKPALLRDCRSQVYSPFAYMMGWSVAEMCVSLFLPTLFCAVVYPLAHLSSDIDRFVFFLVCCMLLHLIGRTIGLLIAILSTWSNFLFAVVPVAAIGAVLLSGSVIASPHLWPPLAWFPFLNMYYYAWRLLVVNEAQGRNYICQLDQPLCQPNGTQLLGEYGIDVPNKGLDLLVLVGFFVCLYMVTLGALCWVCHRDSLARPQTYQ